MASNQKKLQRKDSILYCTTTGHQATPSSYYCDVCKGPICANCVTNEHKGHPFSGLKETGEKIGKRIANTLGEIEETIVPKLESQIANIRDGKSKRVQHIESVKAQVSGAYSKIKDQLDKEKKGIFDRLDNTMAEDLDKFNQEESILSKALKKVTKFKSECETAIQLSELQRLIKLEGKIPSVNEMKKVKSSVPSLESIDYIPGEDFPKLLGRLTTDEDLASNFLDETVQRLPTQYDITVLSTYQTKLSKVEAVCVLGPDAVWVGYSRSQRIIKLEERQGTLKKVESAKTSGFCPVNIRVIPTGLLFAGAGQPYIQILGDDGCQSTFKYTEHMPLGLHVNSSGDVLACLLDEYSYAVKPTSVRKVVKYSNTGDVLLQIDYDEKGNNYFWLPQSLTENINSDICVVDVINKHAGRLLVFNAKGILRFRYSGREKSDLSGCTHDHEGNIIISDEFKNRIHTLSIDGAFLGYITTEENRIYRPFAVEIDPSGHLWIGCKSTQSAEAAQVVHIKYSSRR